VRSWTQDGSKIVNLTLATSETWNDRASGERKEKTEWHRIVVFNDRVADVAERFLKKGAKIYVEGALQTRKWTDQSGAEKYSTEVVIGRFNGQLTMLDSKRDGDAAPQPREAPRQQSKPSEPSWDRPKGGDLDDQIPF
jgi:single-strand DNA-binding protein